MIKEERRINSKKAKKAVKRSVKAGKRLRNIIRRTKGKEMIKVKKLYIDGHQINEPIIVARDTEKNPPEVISIKFSPAQIDKIQMKVKKFDKRTKLFFAWYDFWIGFYYDRKIKRLYICPLPCFVISISLRGKRWM